MSRSPSAAAILFCITVSGAGVAAARQLEPVPPVRFEENRGQFPYEVLYAAAVREGTVFVTSDRLIFSRRDGAPAELRFGVTARSTAIEARHELPIRSNYYLGDRRIEGVRSFERILLKGAFQGTDVEVYGSGSEVAFAHPPPGEDSFRLEWTDVAPVAVPTAPVITFSTYVGGDDFEDVARVRTDRDGNIYLAGDTRSASLLGVEAARADDAVFVVKLSPQMQVLFVTVFGGTTRGTTEQIMDLAVDQNGRSVVIGATNAADFPLVEPLQPAYGGGGLDAFVARLDPDGRISYSTFIGGPAIDGGGGRVTVDREGAIYGCFSTYSVLPLVDPVQDRMHGRDDLYLFKLPPEGDRIVFSSYLGGSGPLTALPNESVNALLLDAAGDLVVVGYTFSADFPLQRPVQSTFAGVSDVFITKIRGHSMLFSTFFGGNGLESGGGEGFAAAVDAQGDIWFAARTSSTNLPLVEPIHAAPSTLFLAQLEGDGSAIEYSSYLAVGPGDAGGAGLPHVTGLVTAPDGSILLAGTTASKEWPLLHPIPMLLGGFDGFVMRFTAAGHIAYSTYLGGTGGDSIASVAIDRQGRLYIAGETSSRDFPLLSPLQGTFAAGRDGFLVRFAEPTSPGKRRAVRR